MDIEARTTINRPARDVFRLICDWSYLLPSIDPGVVSIEKTTDGPITEGTVWRETLSGPGGVKVVVTSEFTDIHPNERLVFTFTSPGLRGLGRLTCRGRGDVTELAISIHATTSGPGWLMYPVLRWDFPRRERRRMDAAKRLLESRELDPSTAEPFAIPQD